MYLCYTIPTYSCTQVWVVRYPGQVVQRGEGVIQCIYATQYLHIHVLKVGVYATLDKWSNGEALSLQNIYDVIFNLGFLLIIIGGVG